MINTELQQCVSIHCNQVNGLLAVAPPVAKDDTDNPDMSGCVDSADTDCVTEMDGMMTDSCVFDADLYQ